MLVTFQIHLLRRDYAGRPIIDCPPVAQKTTNYVRDNVVLDVTNIKEPDNVTAVCVSLSFGNRRFTNTVSLWQFAKAKNNGVYNRAIPNILGSKSGVSCMARMVYEGCDEELVGTGSCAPSLMTYRAEPVARRRLHHWRLARVAVVLDDEWVQCGLTETRLHELMTSK